MTLMVDPAPVEATRFDAMRHAMVASQLRTNGVNDARLVSAMARVPREDYLPADQRAMAYRDQLLPIGGGRHQNSPLATGLLLTNANIVAGERVLLVGAAGGYTAALIAALGGSVVALEDTALANAAPLAGVETVSGPLAAGWADGGPYDLIVIDGAVEHVPEALVGQLKLGGRVVSGVLDRGVTRLATGVRSAGGFGLTDFLDLECAILPGFTRPQTFQF